MRNASRAFSRSQDEDIGEGVHAIVSYHGRSLSGRNLLFAQPWHLELSAMAAPSLSAQLFLTVVNSVELEDIISGCLTDDKFIVHISRACRWARRQARLQERRFSRLERGEWVYRDRMRGPG